MVHQRRIATDATRKRIREAGLRCTAARLAVLEHLQVAAAPRTHAEVSTALAARGFDRVTIYRNLTELTEARLLSRVDLGDHVWRFESRHGHEAGPGDGGHPHFVCTSCGEVSCLDDVRVAITPHVGRRVRGTSRSRPGERRTAIRTVTEILLKGRCGGCS